MAIINLSEATIKSKIKKSKPRINFKNLVVPDLYFCPHIELRDKLNVLKMRNSRFSLTNVVNSLKKEKYRQARNNPDFTDNYMDLHIFECPNLKIFHAIICKVREYNEKQWKKSKLFGIIL
jgi:hypothetical protein